MKAGATSCNLIFMILLQFLSGTKSLRDSKSISPEEKVIAAVFVLYFILFFCAICAIFGAISTK